MLNLAINVLNGEKTTKKNKNKKISEMGGGEIVEVLKTSLQTAPDCRRVHKHGLLLYYFWKGMHAPNQIRSGDRQ